MRNDNPKARLDPLLGWSTLALAMMLATPTEAGEGDPASPSGEADEASSSIGMPDILVRGTRTHDVDIRRTRDDIQPYVVFEAAQIERSAAQNVEDFLQSNLPMNSQQTTTSQLGPQTSPHGRIDLRGLGADQPSIGLGAGSSGIRDDPTPDRACHRHPISLRNPDAPLR